MRIPKGAGGPMEMIIESLQNRFHENPGRHPDLDWQDAEKRLREHPEAIRRLGGALFCERRYGAVFTFHNGADSYYSVRGWRGYLLV